MGLSRKNGNTNLITLRTELNRLNMDSKHSEEKKYEQPLELTKGVVGEGSVKATIKEAKRRGRRANELIDGSRLMTC